MNFRRKDVKAYYFEWLEPLIHAWSWSPSKVCGITFKQGLKIAKKAKRHELLDSNSPKLGPVFYFGMELLGYGVLFSKFRQQEEAPPGGAKRGQQQQQQPANHCSPPRASMIPRSLWCAAVGNI